MYRRPVISTSIVIVGGSAAASSADDPDLLDPRAADDQPGLPLGSPGCSSSCAAAGSAIARSAASSPSTASAQAGDRAAGGDLEHVRGEAAVGEAQVERGRARVALEVEVRDLGDLGPVWHRVRDRALHQRLVAHRLLVGPRRRDDLLLERVGALAALLDRDAASSGSSRLPSVQNSRTLDGLAEPPGALDVVPVADPRRSRASVASIRTVTRSACPVAAVRRARRTRRVGSPSGSTRLRQPRRSKSSSRRSHSRSRSGATSGASAARSSASHAAWISGEQLAAAGSHDVGRERRIVLGGLGGRELDAALALRGVAARGWSGALAAPPECCRRLRRDARQQHRRATISADQDQRAEPVAEDRDPDQDLDQDVDRRRRRRRRRRPPPPRRRSRPSRRLPASAARARISTSASAISERRSRCAALRHRATASARAGRSRLVLRHVLVGVIAQRTSGPAATCSKPSS